MHTHIQEQQHSGAGPLIATVLQAMQTNIGIGDFVAQLARTYLDDSSQAQLLGALGSRALEAPTDAEFDEVEAPPDSPHDNQLQDELELYQSALGICSACLDEDPDCEVCDGQPVKPDARMFMELVLPAALELPQSARRKVVQVLAGSLNRATPVNANRG